MTLVYWGVGHNWPSEYVALPSIHETLFELDFSSLNQDALPAIFGFLLVGLFDVSGVLFGLSQLARLVDDDGNIPGSLWAFVGSAVGTIIASLMGCSPIIIHLESAAGIKEGGKTGMSAVVTGIWFLLSLFFAPLFGSVPSVATAPVLLLLGASMMNLSKNIDWDRMDQAIPAFLTVIIMPFTFSIPNGLFFGLSFSALLYFTTGRFMDDLAAKFSSGEEKYLINGQGERTLWE